MSDFEIKTRRTCGTEVTATGGLTYQSPCTVVLGQPVCSPLHVTSWRGALETELGTANARLNQFKGLVQGGARRWSASTTQAQTDIEDAARTLANTQEWTHLPSTGVSLLKEAAAKTRCAAEVFDAAIREDSSAGDTGDSSASPSSGSGAAIVGGLAVVAGLGLVVALGRRR